MDIYINDGANAVILNPNYKDRSGSTPPTEAKLQSLLNETIAAITHQGGKIVAVVTMKVQGDSTPRGGMVGKAPDEDRLVIFVDRRPAGM